MRHNHLKTLPLVVAKAIILIDKEMESPSSPERGKRIAMILNGLDTHNDAALHFGLGYGFKRISNLKKKISNDI